MKLGCSYSGNRIVRHAAQDMRMLKELGFTFVVHTFSEFDLMFHRDTMREIVAVTHEAGLEAHIDPWGLGKVFGGEPFTNFAAHNMFTACQVLDDGNPAPFACPNSPLFRDFMKDWIAAARDSGADIAFWDEPHFYHWDFLGARPGRWGCRCSFCQKIFGEKNGNPMPREETEEVKIFKRECLREFLGLMTQWAKEAGLQNILCIPPYLEPSEVREYWLPYARLPQVSVLGTDPYWQWHEQPVQSVYDYAAAVKSLCDETGKEAQIWIQACKIPRGREEEVAQAVDLAFKAGIRNLAAWGFEACAHESWLKCEDSPKTWSILVNAFQKTAGQGMNS